MIDLKEEVERLRTIKDCEREIDWWCQSLSAPRSWHMAEALHGVCQPLSPCRQVVEGNRLADSAAVNSLSSPPPSSNLREEEEWTGTGSARWTSPIPTILGSPGASAQ